MGMMALSLADSVERGKGGFSTGDSVVWYPAVPPAMPPVSGLGIATTSSPR